MQCPKLHIFVCPMHSNNGQNIGPIQERWATAKMTARCAQYMGALKIFESPWVYARGY